MRRDVDAARGEEAGAALEQVERGVEVDLGRRSRSARSSAAALSGSPAIARKRSISARVSCGSEVCAPSAACSRKRSAISPTERPPTALMPAIDSRSVTSACAAFGIGAGHRREHALIFRRARAPALTASTSRSRSSASGAVEILDQAALPRRREIERRDQRGEQADVAHADVGRGHAVFGRGLEPERQHLGIGGGGVGAAEGLDAGLQEFARAVVALAEHRAEIAEAGRPAGRGGEAR